VAKKFNHHFAAFVHPKLPLSARLGLCWGARPSRWPFSASRLGVFALIPFTRLCRSYGAWNLVDRVATNMSRLWRCCGQVNGAKLSLFNHLNPSKTIENLHFNRTNRIFAAQIDLCPHGLEAGSHGTANCPHGLNFCPHEVLADGHQ